MEVVSRMLDKFHREFEDFIAILHPSPAQQDVINHLRHDLANIRTLGHPHALEMRTAENVALIVSLLQDVEPGVLVEALHVGGDALIDKLDGAMDEACSK